MGTDFGTDGEQEETNKSHSGIPLLQDVVDLCVSSNMLMNVDLKPANGNYE